MSLVKGYNVYATDAVEGDKLKQLAEAGAKTKRLDVTSPESISSFKQYLGDQPVDFLMNIAGLFPYVRYLPSVAMLRTYL